MQSIYSFIHRESGGEWNFLLLIRRSIFLKHDVADL